jgi:hypothetical protein
MRNYATPLLAALLAAAATAGVATAGTHLTAGDDHHRDGDRSYSIGLGATCPTPTCRRRSACRTWSPT